MNINNFNIGKHVFIIAELSANHNQDINIAKKTIIAAKEAGADAIKVQTFRPDTITMNCSNDYFKINQNTIWDGQTLFELYQKAYMPWEWTKELQDLAHKIGLIFFSSPFDPSAVDFLEDLNVPAYKIASFEITDIPLIEYVASKQKPIIISTGIAKLEDIELAVQACKKQNNHDIILLKCFSAYPAPVDEMNLNTIPDLAKKFNLPIGISDHTTSNSVPIAAVALGATVIEKHMVLDKKLNTPDSAFSLTPSQFKTMVLSVRETTSALGTINYELTPKQVKSREHSRSLFIVKNIKKGDILTNENIRSIRPGFGLAPKHTKDVIGKTATSDIAQGTPLNWNHLN
jgi:pseudaminic acid synthase